MYVFLVGCVTLAAGVDTEVNQHLYPAETKSIVVVDLEALRASGLFDREMREGFEFFLQDNEHMRKLGEILKTDLSMAAKRFTICSTGEMDRDAATVTIANGDYSFDRYSDALGQMAEDGELTVFTVDDLPVYYNHRSREAIYFAVVDDGVMVASNRKSMIEDSIRGLTELREPNKELLERLEWSAEDTKDAEVKPCVYLAGVFPQAAKREMESNESPIKNIAKDMVGYNLTIHLGEDVLFRGRLQMSSAEAAGKAKGVFDFLINGMKIWVQNQRQRPDIVELLQTLEIKADKADLMFNLTAPKSMIAKVQSADRSDPNSPRNRFRRMREEQRKAEEAEQEKSSNPTNAEKPSSESDGSE